MKNTFNYSNIINFVEKVEKFINGFIFSNLGLIAAISLYITNPSVLLYILGGVIIFYLFIFLIRIPLNKDKKTVSMLNKKLIEIYKDKKRNRIPIADMEVFINIKYKKIINKAFSDSEYMYGMKIIYTEDKEKIQI